MKTGFQSNENNPPKVFISYSHDSTEHMSRVLALSNHLRAEGVDCSLDQYEMSPARGWARWTEMQITEADYVLVVCTATYLRRFKVEEGIGIGLGVKWEGAVINQELYEAEVANTKFIPLLFSPEDSAYIPMILRGTTHYKIYTEEGFEGLYRRITNQPSVLKPHLGKLRPMSPLKVEQTFHAVSVTEEGECFTPPDLQAYFTTQRKIIDENAKRFVGRANVRQAFDHFVATHPRGYFIVCGGPGQGKTAVSCHLVKTRGYIYHFISRTGGRSDSRLILRSLLTQLAQTCSSPAATPALPNNISGLARDLEGLLSTITEKNKRVVFVIDALDELVEESAEGFPFLLTDSLPEGAYVLVTSRPGDRLNQLEEQLFATPYEIYDLGALELTEMQGMMSSSRADLSKTEMERVAEASQGSPLYLRAVIEELERDRGFNLRDLPGRIEGFFRHATKSVAGGENKILRDLLGVLAVARKPLSLRELGQITGQKHRQVYEQGVGPIRQFLLEVDNLYCFYHVGFHDFVTRELIYEDELQDYHRMVTEWLSRPENRFSEYRLSTLAHHLFESGKRERLREVIDQKFLSEKVRRLGYAVLEDVELLTLSMLDAGDPALVEQCVEIVEALREVVGGDIIEDATRSLQLYRPGPQSFRANLIAPSVASVSGIDVYVGMLPKTDVSADFFEVIPAQDRLIIAIGDVPSLGLKSAFVARFIGNVFRTLVRAAKPFHLGEVLSELNAVLSHHDYFRWITMQCIEIDVKKDIFAIANAAHPYPVLYSAKRHRCDRLPVNGEPIHSSFEEITPAVKYEQRHAEIYAGDILVLITDGLLEAHLLRGHPYGYRFKEILEQMATQSARSIGESILDDWRSYQRAGDFADDVTVIVIKKEF